MFNFSRICLIDSTIILLPNLNCTEGLFCVVFFFLVFFLYENCIFEVNCIKPYKIIDDAQILS